MTRFMMLLFSIAVFLSPVMAADQPPFSRQIALDYSHIDQTDPTGPNQVIRAFVATGSTSSNCLATLSELSSPQFGIVLYCAARQPSGLGGIPGILISVFFPQPVDPSLVLFVTVHQNGAKRYRNAVLCTKADGC
jgi:hypothetical protein